MQALLVGLGVEGFVSRLVLFWRQQSLGEVGSHDPFLGRWGYVLKENYGALLACPLSHVL